MEPPPTTVTVTDLRRTIAKVIDGVNLSKRPVFITQNGYPTAVLLSCERYDDLLHLTRSPQSYVPLPGSDRERYWRDRQDDRLIETPYGLCDVEFARFLRELGFDPRVPSLAVTAEQYFEE